MKQSDMKEKKYFKDLSRRDYIEKANEIVRRDGVQGLTIRRIAQEMNCSSACLYHYFENVEELLFYAQIGFLNYYLEEINRHENSGRTPGISISASGSAIPGLPLPTRRPSTPFSFPP